MREFDTKTTGKSISLCAFARANECLVKASHPEGSTHNWDWQNGWTVVTPNKEEEKMDITYEQRRYLERRVGSVYDDHSNKLRSDFHMGPQYPATLREALDRIEKGTVKFPKGADLEEMGYDLDGNFYSDAIWGSVDWRTEEADKDGFKAAEKLLNKAFTDAQDTIKVADPKDGLTALKEFENKTFH